MAKWTYKFNSDPNGGSSAKGHFQFFSPEISALSFPTRVQMEALLHCFLPQSVHFSLPPHCGPDLELYGKSRFLMMVHRWLNSTICLRRFFGMSCVSNICIFGPTGYVQWMSLVRSAQFQRAYLIQVRNNDQNEFISLIFVNGYY